LEPPSAQVVPPRFIVIEGIDGAGKSTQLNLLAAALRARGEQLFVSREPSDSPWGRQLRASAAQGRRPPAEELELFLLDREHHLQQQILPALAAGATVLLDRYLHSTIAYQGIDSDDPIALEQQVRARAVAPDCVVLLDIEVESALQRIAARGNPDRFEQRHTLQQIRERFLALAEHDPLLQIVDGRGESAAVHQRILRQLRVVID